MAQATPVTIRGYGWPLPFVLVPGLWDSYPRVLVMDPDAEGEARIHKSDAAREQPVGDLIWEGRTRDLRFQKLPLVIKVSAPGGSFRFWVDVPEDKRTLARLGFLD